MTNKQKGFTLIELLVVITVIALLVTVVLSSLDVSRKKSANAGIKANMRTISQQVELIYINSAPQGYGTAAFSTAACPTALGQAPGTVFNDATLLRAIVETNKQASSPAVCSSTTTRWAVSAQLKTPEGSSTHWCVETEGKAKDQIGNITTTSCL